MLTPAGVSRQRWLWLGVLFVITLAFQGTLWIQALSGLLAHQEPIATRWTLTFILTVFTPLLCLLLGFYVTFVRIEDSRAWLLLAVLITFGISANGSNYPDEIMRWSTPLKHAALIFRSICIRSWPLWMVLFAIYFPERSQFEWRRPMLKWILVAPSLIACCIGVISRIASNERGWFEAAVRPIEQRGGVAISISFWYSVLAFLLILLAKSFDSIGPDARRRLRVLLSGLGLSIVPPLILDRVAHALKIHEASLPAWLQLPVFSMLALLPITLAYVTVVERALDVRVIIRQSVQYALARRGALLLQILVSLIVIIWVVAFSAHMGFGGRLLITIAGVEAVLFMQLGAVQLAGWIDRRFFREDYRAEQVLTSLAQSVRSFVELGPLLQSVVEKVSQALHVSKIAVFLREGGSFRPALATGVSQPLQASLKENAPLVRTLSERQRPLPVSARDENGIASARLGGLETQLLVPLFGQSELLGFVSLGPKISETPYSPTDLDLLQSVALQTALAIENSRLTAAVAAETARREVLDRELAIAREVQQRLFPQVKPDIEGLEYAAVCRPAREVGGDYYDYFKLRDGAFGIAIG